jgi:hypothetical protein
MAQVQLEQQEASRRDSLEIQEKIDDVVTALTHRFDGRGSPPFNSTFQTVARDIQEVCLRTDHSPLRRFIIYKKEIPEIPTSTSIRSVMTDVCLTASPSILQV